VAVIKVEILKSQLASNVSPKMTEQRTSENFYLVCGFLEGLNLPLSLIFFEFLRVWADFGETFENLYLLGGFLEGFELSGCSDCHGFAPFRRVIFRVHCCLCVAVYGSESQCVVVCCSVLQYVALCCSVLLCVALCCSALQFFCHFDE